MIDELCNYFASAIADRLVFLDKTAGMAYTLERDGKRLPAAIRKDGNPDWLLPEACSVGLSFFDLAEPVAGRQLSGNRVLLAVRFRLLLWINTSRLNPPSMDWVSLAAWIAVRESAGEYMPGASVVRVTELLADDAQAAFLKWDFPASMQLFTHPYAAAALRFTVAYTPPTCSIPTFTANTAQPC